MDLHGNAKITQIVQSGAESRFPRHQARVRAPDEARRFDPHVAKPLGTTRPRGAPPWAAALQPRAPSPPGLREALVPAGGGAVHARLAVITPPGAVQGPAHRPHPAATGVPTPGGAPLTRVPPCLARRAARQRGRARAIRTPAPRTAQDVHTGAAPGGLVRPRHHPRLRRGPLPSTRAEPCPQLLSDALGRLRLVTRGHHRSRVPHPAGLTATAGLAPVLNPPVAGLVPVHGGQERCTDTSYKGAQHVVAFSTRLPRAQLRPRDGAGFLGALLTLVTPDAIPTERERGGRHGTSRPAHDPGAGGQRPV